MAEAGEDPSLTEWFCFKNDLFFLQRHRPFVCWCSAAPLRDITRLCRVCSGKIELGSSLIPQTKSLAAAPVYSCGFLPLVVVPKWAHSSLYTPAVSYSPASISSSPLSALLIFSTDWRGSLMQVFQWNLYNPDVNPVASPSGLDMSGNEHYWADKISEHFFHRKPTDFHLWVWHASSLRLLERHTLDCLWQDMNRRAPADMKGQAGMAVRKEKNTLFFIVDFENVFRKGLECQDCNTGCVRIAVWRSRFLEKKLREETIHFIPADTPNKKGSAKPQTSPILLLQLFIFSIKTQTMELKSEAMKTSLAAHDCAAP